jgi:mRNA interferase RelE/StbE
VRIGIAIRALADDPRPPGAALLTGEGAERAWRVRVGDYRILYQIRDDQLLVIVIRVGHRREIYRGRRISEESQQYGMQRPDAHGGSSWISQLAPSPRTG